MTDKERIKSILSDLKCGYISYDNFYGDGCHGKRLIKIALDKQIGMTRAEYVYSILDDKSKIFEIIKNDCPGDYDLEDDNITCGDGKCCFECWMKDACGIDRRC